MKSILWVEEEFIDAEDICRKFDDRIVKDLIQYQNILTLFCKNKINHSLNEYKMSKNWCPKCRNHTYSDGRSQCSVCGNDY